MGYKAKSVFWAAWMEEHLPFPTGRKDCFPGRGNAWARSRHVTDTVVCLDLSLNHVGNPPSANYLDSAEGSELPTWDFRAICMVFKPLAKPWGLARSGTNLLLQPHMYPSALQSLWSKHPALISVPGTCSFPSPRPFTFHLPPPIAGHQSSYLLHTANSYSCQISIHEALPQGSLPLPAPE